MESAMPSGSWPEEIHLLSFETEAFLIEFDSPECPPQRTWEASQARLNTQKYSTSLMTVVELCSRKYGKESESESRSVVSNSLQPHGLYSPWNSPGQNTGVGSLSLLRGIFPTQESNSGLLHCRQILYHLSHQRSLFMNIKVNKNNNPQGEG